MSTSSSLSHLRNWWLANEQALGDAHRGLLVVGCPEPFGEEWRKGIEVWDPQLANAPSSNASTVILPWMDTKARSRPDTVRLSFTAAITALERGLAVLAASPLSINQLKGLDASKDSPTKLDVDTLLQPSELAYLLSSTCVVLSPGEQPAADAEGGLTML